MSASLPEKAGIIRVACVVAAVGAAAVLLTVQSWYRGTEALLAGDLVTRVLGYPVIVARPEQTMFFAFHGTGPAHMLGLQVSLGCSSVLLIVPMLLLTAVLLSMRKPTTARVLIALVLAATLLVTINLFRLVMIAALVEWWGVQAGFGWGHTLFGSLLMLVGMAAALGVFVVVLGHKGRSRTRPV